MSIGDQNKSQLGGSGIYAKTRVGRIRFFMLDLKYVMNSQQSEQQIFDKKNYFLPWAISHLGQVAVNMFQLQLIITIKSIKNIIRYIMI